MRAIETVSTGLGIMGALTVAGGAAAAARFYRGQRRADEVWEAARFQKVASIGAVKRLTILPLVDWQTSGADLAGEPGVAYLVRADDTTILFDLGLNKGGEQPSPLSRNMAALGVARSEIDIVVISHLHADHVGGRRGHLSLSGAPDDLGDLPVFVPAPLEGSTPRPTVVGEPRSVAPGVASTGPIPSQDFIFGWTLEQSLAINVDGKGIVLVVGCGHPTVQRIVERAEALFDSPIYGVVGGLHYPVTASRWTMGPLPLQRIFGTGKWPWDPIDREDVQAGIACLQRRQPRLVALSAHDSCDWSLNAFRSEFTDAYRGVVVGQEILV